MQNNENTPSNLQNPFALQRPDWTHWKSIKSIKLWHAVALACDLDPYQFTYFGSPNLNKYFSRPPDAFKKLLTMAIGSLGGGGILKVISFSPEGIEESEIAPSIFGAWITSINYQIPPDFPWQDVPVLPLSREWPWGTYETELLRKLALAANRFWRNYDPADTSTAPINKDVIDWLVEHGVANRTAEIMATILRVDGLPTGPRK
jgi:hypothetical protein